MTRERTILRASPLHAEVLSTLHATSFPAPWRVEEFMALLGQPGVAAWISLDGDAPAGFIMVRAAADEAEILTVAVAPERRRNGAARQLIAEARKGLADAGATRLFLEVAADNAAAIALYGTCGFTVCGRRPHYYTADRAKPVDAVLMNVAVTP